MPMNITRRDFAEKHLEDALAEPPAPTLSLTWIVKLTVPVPDGVPLMVIVPPESDAVSPSGRLVGVRLL